MIAALIIWAYLLIILLLYGRGSARLLGRWLKIAQPGEASTWLVVVTGLVIFGTLASFLSLFIALGGLAAFLILAVAPLSFLLPRGGSPRILRKPVGMEWLGVLVLLAAALIVLENATHAPSNPDTNLYHAQTIRWVETYRAVPGLGNLNGRLAYNSDWLVLNAATSFSFLQLGSFHLLPGLLFLLCALYFGEGLFGLMRQPSLPSNWLKVLFLALAFRILTSEISSPGTDLPVILLTWVLVTLAVEYLESKRTELDERDSMQRFRLMVIGILPAFIVTLKLSAAPLMLLSVYAFVTLLLRRERRSAWTLATLSALVLMPWILRSLTVSGYPVFPIARLDLFAFDWKIPTDYVDAVRDGVIGWARLPNKDWVAAVQSPFQTWLPEWFSDQSFNQRLMILAALLSPLILFLGKARRFIIPFLVAYAGIWFWILSAPNIRFGYGFLLSVIAFVCAVSLSLTSEALTSRLSRVMPVAAAALLLLMLGYTFMGSFEPASLQERLLLPIGYAEFRASPCPVGSLPVHCASSYKLCGYEPFPCVPAVPSGVYPRGETLQDGFYSTK